MYFYCIFRSNLPVFFRYFVIWVLFLVASSLVCLSFVSLNIEHHTRPIPPPFPITRGKRGMCALTFDGDYHANLADDILRILREKNVKATFFLTGRFMKLYPEVVKRIVEEGHEVGNHTTHHPHLTEFEKTRRQKTLPGVTPGFLYDELYETERIFMKLTGKPIARLWRAPYGEENREIVNWTRRLGYWEIRWTYDTIDWLDDTLSPKYMTSKEMLEFLLSRDLSGSIILMHVGSLRKKDFPTEMLPELIDSLRARGIEPVPVSTLLGLEEW
ncbi:hypothetical protein DRQ20_06925 [bacterium]|nr:MAG: hypothetical protein DRQ20_06925 [bacterium]